MHGIELRNYHIDFLAGIFGGSSCDLTGARTNRQNTRGDVECGR